MRPNNVKVDAGRLRLPSRRVLLLLALGAVAGWALYSLVQESCIAFQLNAQAAQLSRQNQALAAQNSGYQRDAVALQSGAAAEEDARLNGYARWDENVYLVGPPPSPQPSPSSAARAAHQVRSGSGFWSWLAGVLHL